MEEVSSVKGLIGEHAFKRIVRTGEISDEEVNCLSAYYIAREELPSGADPASWIVNRVKN